MPRRSTEAQHHSRHPCFYGIDFPTSEELIAHNRTAQQVGEFLEVDSLAYLSLDRMLSCMNLPVDDYCTACWSGKYKIPIDQPQSNSASSAVS